MVRFTPAGSSTLGVPEDEFIYSLCPLDRPRRPPGGTGTGSSSAGTGSLFSVIASDNSVRFGSVDAAGAIALAGAAIPDAHGGGGVTAQCRFDDDDGGGGAGAKVLATAGRDGCVHFWDARTHKLELTLSNPKKMPLSALACSSSRNLVVAGTESDKVGPGDAAVFLWDPRNPAALRSQYVDSHTDTITDIRFHPTDRHLLLTASTDSLVNLFDTTAADADEDDALLLVYNHHSAVHRAGFLSPTVVYALGTDETLSFYTAPDSVKHADDTVTDPNPVQLGDLRQSIGADYIVKLLHPTGSSSTPPFLSSGSFTSGWLDLIPLVNPAPGSLDWKLAPESRIRIDGAHGQEIVRDIQVDSEHPERSVVLTCGEDGHVRSWLPTPDPSPGKQRGPTRQSKRGSQYKPY